MEQYRPGRERWRQDAIPIVIASALFMHLMDTAALATALPTMARAFGRNAVDLRVALTAYVLTIAVLVPASAWLSARVGTRRLFVAAMIVFGIGSATCAGAQDLGQLVAARILQGAGGAMMTPVGRSLIVRAVPCSRLVHAMTLFTLPAIIAPLIGPPLAGLIVEAHSWRWIFLINLPVCAIGVFAVLKLAPVLDDAPPERFDFQGFALLAVGMVTLSALFDVGSWSAGQLLIKTLLASALVLISLAYRRHERRSTAPVLNFRILVAPTLWISLWSGGLQRLAVGALPFLLPLLLQQSLGMSPLEAGKVMIASAVGGLAARFVIPLLLKRLRVRMLMAASALAASIGTAMLALFNADTPQWTMMAFLAGLGLVRSGFFIPATAIAYVDLEPRAIGQATVLFTMVQQFSFSLGVSLSAGLLTFANDGAGTFAATNFALAFVGVAAVSGLSIFWVWRLPPSAGEVLRQTQPG